MRYVIGVALIVIGVGQFLWRDRIARANAASNKEMWGTFSGPKSMMASKIGSTLVAVVFVVLGVLALIGVFHIK